MLTREDRILGITLLVAVGFSAAVFYHYWLGTYRELEYPYNTFLFRPADRWQDFYWLVRISSDPYSVVRGFSNLPFLYRYASLFSILPLKPGLFIHLVTFFLAYLVIIWHSLRLSSRLTTALVVFVVGFMNYPVLFAIDRANFELTTFLFLYSFVMLYRSSPRLSATLLGVAIALKGFPAILALLMLADRKWREFFLAAGVAIGLSLASLLAFPGGLASNLEGALANIRAYTSGYVVNLHGLYFGNNLLGAAKFVSIALGQPSLATSETLVIVATLVAIALTAATAAYLVFFERVFWRKVTVLICALNLLPVVSGDYKLIHLLIPLFLFVNEAEPSSSNRVLTFLFGALFIPKAFARLPALPEANVALVVNPMLMLILAASAVIMGVQSRTGRSIVQGVAPSDPCGLRSPDCHPPEGG